MENAKVKLLALAILVPQLVLVLTVVAGVSGLLARVMGLRAGHAMGRASIAAVLLFVIFLSTVHGSNKALAISVPLLSIVIGLATAGSNRVSSGGPIDITQFRSWLGIGGRQTPIVDATADRESDFRTWLAAQHLAEVLPQDMPLLRQRFYAVER
jgi:hypothetical protein